jgi:hypothetical protein
VPLIFSSGRYCTPLAIPSTALANTDAG